MNYELNMLHHVGVVVKRLHAVAETAAHEEDDNTPSGPTGRGLKNLHQQLENYLRSKSLLYDY